MSGRRATLAQTPLQIGANGVAPSLTTKSEPGYFLSGFLGVSMSIATRSALCFILLTGLVVGAWAFFFPLAFYTSFPGFGRTWVSMDGPFNQHLVRDAGAAYLMTGALAGLGLLRPSTASPFAVGFATLFFNLPHFAYHLTHLAMYGPLDRTLNVAVLLLAVLCSAWLVAPQARMRP